MTLIALDVETCLDCPKHEKKMGPNAYSDDIWCSLLKRKIKGYVERASEMPPLPDDCPLLFNNIHRLKAAVEGEEK